MNIVVEKNSETSDFESRSSSEFSVPNTDCESDTCSENEFDFFSAKENGDLASTLERSDSSSKGNSLKIVKKIRIDPSFVKLVSSRNVNQDCVNPDYERELLMKEHALSSSASPDPALLAEEDDRWTELVESHLDNSRSLYDGRKMKYSYEYRHFRKWSQPRMKIMGESRYARWLKMKVSVSCFDLGYFL